MATERQIELFRKLTQDRDFRGFDVNILREQFAGVSDRSASEWIEKALTRPKIADEDQPATPPPF